METMRKAPNVNTKNKITVIRFAFSDQNIVEQQNSKDYKSSINLLSFCLKRADKINRNSRNDFYKTTYTVQLASL